MPTLLRLSFAAAIIITVSHAHAAEKQMPIDFVGEWCTPTKDGNSTEWTLPSWTEDGKCTDILSVEKWGFLLNDKTCLPESIRLKSDTAPSGTAYMATISARCVKEGPVNYRTAPVLTFEFQRYKGRLTIKEK